VLIVWSFLKGVERQGSSEVPIRPHDEREWLDRRHNFQPQSRRLVHQGATRPGGLGAAFDWHLLENLDLKLPFMVSGGLNAANVAEAVRVTRAGGVDISSGVERAPGLKDPEMIRAFVRAARATEELMT